MLDICFTVVRLFLKITDAGIYKSPLCIIDHAQQSSYSQEQRLFYEEHNAGLDPEQQIPEEDWDYCVWYNLKLMSKSVDILDGAIWVILVVALILDILCYKYRHLAHYYMYIHLVHMILVRMMPNSEGAYISVQPVQFGYIMGGLTIAFYCDQTYSIFMQPLMYYFHFVFTA